MDKSGREKYVMKKISIVVPTYNEEDNVEPMAEALSQLFENELAEYDYEILFIDNDSADTTRIKLRKICENNKKIKAIFNASNFGWMRSPIYGLRQTTGDCSVLLCADFQEPVQEVLYRTETQICQQLMTYIKRQQISLKIMMLMREKSQRLL